jgi:DNA-binding transcriptional MerR regulator
MVGEWLKPRETGRRLRMPASTLRVYSTKFAPLLSPSASQPVDAPGGNPISRLYSSTDVAILSQAKELLSQGMTYKQTLEELFLSLPGSRARTSTPTPSTAVECPQDARLVSATQLEAILKAAMNNLVDASVARSQRLAQEWQSLAEERASESLRLQERLRELEEALREGQSRHFGWLARLFAGVRQARESQGSLKPVSPVWET